MNRFGLELKAARVKAGMTLAKLASRVDSVKGYVSGIETGAVRPPSARVIRRICRVLKLDEQYMLALAVLAKMPKALKVESLRMACDDALGVTSLPQRRAEDAINNTLRDLSTVGV
jgi:transcriptional regulator with XRE-family HTH domain